MYDEKEFLEADVLTKTRMHRDYRNKRADQLIKQNAPIELIEHEQYLAEMSYLEFKTYLKKVQIEEEKQQMEYAKNNALDPQICKKINNWLDNNLEKLSDLQLESTVLFHFALDPLQFMSEEDFNNDLYTHIWHPRRMAELNKRS